MKMPFGKHKGTPVAMLPVPYLSWLETVVAPGQLRQEIVAALQRKDKPTTGSERLPPGKSPALTPDLRQQIRREVVAVFKELLTTDWETQVAQRAFSSHRLSCN